MRRLIAFVLDTLTIILLFIISLIYIFSFLTMQQGDFLIISQALSIYANKYIVYLFIYFVILIFSYYIILPLFIKTTLGGIIMNIEITPKKQTTLIALFLKNLVGMFWDILLFPVTILLFFFKKHSFSSKLSGLDYQKNDFKIFIRLLTLVLLIIFYGFTLNSIWHIMQNPKAYLTCFIDYKKYLQSAIELRDYKALKSLLPKYKEKYGEDNEYILASCLANAYESINEEAQDANLKICNKAENIFANDVTKKPLIILAKIQIYKNLDTNYKTIDELYNELWTQYEYKGVEMLEYFKYEGKSDRQKALKDFEKWLELNNKGLDLSTENLYSIAELFFDLESYKNALSYYTYLLDRVNDDNSRANIYLKIGESYYLLRNYTEALKYFNKAKDLNPNYTNIVESYIIDMKIQK